MDPENRQEAEQLWEQIQLIRAGKERPSDDLSPLQRLAWYLSEAAQEPSPVNDAARERARQRLAAAIRSESARTQNDSNARRRSILLSRWSLGAVFATAAIVCVALFVARNRMSFPSLPVNGLVKDHLKLLSDRKFAHWKSDDPKAVALWLSHQVKYPMHVVDLSSEGARLLGGRRCEVNGQVIGLAFYRHGQTRLSMFQVPAGRCRIEGLDEVQVGERTFFVGADKGFNVVGWEGSGTFCVMVSAMETSTLLRMAEVAQREAIRS
jgi:hypothetical protein